MRRWWLALVLICASLVALSATGISTGLQFTGGSSGTYAQCGAQASTGNLGSETRVVWARLNSAPSANNVILSQGGGGASNFTALSAPSISYTRDYVTTDANVAANLSALNWVIGQASFAAAVLDAGVPRLYGGNLTIPATEATSYNAQTTGVGALVDKSANQVQIGGFSGFGQGFGGPIWMVGWFDFAMTPDQIRSVQAQPVRWERRALAFWYPGRNGTARFLDVSGHNIHCTITGAVPTDDYLPRIMFMSPRGL